MIKLLFIAGLTMMTASCQKEKLESKKGVIENRPQILIDKSTQIHLDASIVKFSFLDTTSHFDKRICDSLSYSLSYVKQKGKYKGLSIAIGIPGKGFWQSAIGESGTTTPLNVNTEFHALSLGKVFTSALVLKLIENGKININDTIYKWFPQCPRAKEITICNLLNHTSGIQTYEALYEFALERKLFSQEELIEMAFNYPIKNNPNTYYSYSNTGYVMLGIIMEKVTGLSLEQLFDTYYIAPLKLKNTHVVTKNNLDMIDIRGYDKDALSSTSKWPLTYAAGPIITTPTDALILYNYLFSGNFLSDESIRLMVSEMNIWLYSPNAYYGKGISLFKDLPSGNYLGHTGGHDTFRTCIYYNMENKVFISIFSNTNVYEIETAMFYMTEKLIKITK
jgi:D-alanyl-D-alanine carboxypeptidase